MSLEQLLAVICRNPLCRGVTFSGGEPFAQAEAFAGLAKCLRKKGYEVAAYSGYTFEELLQGTAGQKLLLENIDILIDGRFVREQRSLNLSFRGSGNQRIVNVPESLRQKRAIIEQQHRWSGAEMAG